MKQYIKLIIIIVLLTMGATPVVAQSMSDDKVIEYILKEQNKGTSQSQIVIQLMQKGVTIEQIRRIKAKYNKQKSGEVVGAKNISGIDDEKQKSASRLRNKKKDDKEKKEDNFRKKTFDDEKEKDEELTEKQKRIKLKDMRRELDFIMPDSLDEDFDFLFEKKKKHKREIFGRNIFNNKNLSFEPNMNIATPSNYKLGPGDQVFIDVWGASQKTIESTISPDGTIVIDEIGPVTIGGMTVAQANAYLKRKVGSNYVNSQVRLTVGDTKTITVNIMGEVVTPGTYTISAFASVFHALYMAGGVNEIGTMRDIKVYRNSKLVSTVDVYDYILNGKLTGNVRLADNDVIVVGAYDCLVNVAGKVKRPMFYEMKKNESVATALKYAGGFTGDAYKQSVRVLRKNGLEYQIFNVEEFELGKFQVSDEDSITVDSVIPRFANKVEIKGAVFRPGMYQSDGNIKTVKELIERAGGPKEDAFLDHAVMHRRRSDMTLEVLSIDVAGLLHGRVPDIPLRKEDVLFIPSKKDMQGEQILTIKGEVRYPGIYEYAANETLEDFILQAGGLKEAASTVKVDVARRIKNQQATDSEDFMAQTFSFSLKEGFVVEGEPSFTLEPFDEVYVRRSPGYYEQKNVSVEGEVLFAGTYTLARKSQRLSELVQSAGGLTKEAYIKGARLEREMTAEEKLRVETMIKAAAKENDKDSVSVAKTLDVGTTYYVGIELDKALANPGGENDIVLREGDRLIIPTFTNTVKVNGEVMFSTTVAYNSKQKLTDYIDQAGGFSQKAKKNRVYVINMNGMVYRIKGSGRKYINPGCEIIVPQKMASKKMTISEILTIGTSTASIATMIATIANLVH
ncbi:MAG: SLBB domain-containing protein [Bacteroidaceae bacterium]|jgi:protein involved in polysaccharide export with SLBB domain|nr:SLBB domain-containing protein [Bacteroidaceae bacterium]